MSLKVNSTLGGAPYFTWVHVGPGQARTKKGEKNCARTLSVCAFYSRGKTVYYYRYLNLASLILIFHFVPKPVDLQNWSSRHYQDSHINSAHTKYQPSIFKTVGGVTSQSLK